MYLATGCMIDGLLMQCDGFSLGNQVDALRKLSWTTNVMWRIRVVARLCS